MRRTRRVGLSLCCTAGLLATLAAAPSAQAAAPECFGRRATIVGTPGPDSLTGTPGPDVIVGLGGADNIAGLGGDDLIGGDFPVFASRQINAFGNKHRVQRDFGCGQQFSFSLQGRYPVPLRIGAVVGFAVRATQFPLAERKGIHT